MAESHESAETHNGVGHTSRHLVDDEVVDLTNVLAGRSVDLGPLDVFARNAFVVGRGGCVRCLLADVANAAGDVRAGRPRSDHRKALALAAAQQP